MSQTRLSQISMHGYETSEENSHEVKVYFQSMAHILETEMVGNWEYPSTSSTLKVENVRGCHTEKLILLKKSELYPSPLQRKKLRTNKTNIILYKIIQELVFTIVSCHDESW